MKRRLFLEQMASDTAVPPKVATPSVSGSAAMSPMKDDVKANGIHRQLQAAADVIANDGDDTTSPLPSPRLSSTSLRRIKRRLFLDKLECSDLETASRMVIDNDCEIHQKASSSSMDNKATFMDGGDFPMHLMLSSWSDKVEHDRTLQGPPKLRLSYALSDQNLETPP